MNGKGTDTFKTAIQYYLEYRASTDELFAPLFANPNKNIDECCKYIICEVHKSGMNGFDDDETENTHTERDSTTIQEIAQVIKDTTSIRI